MWRRGRLPTTLPTIAGHVCVAAIAVSPAACARPRIPSCEPGMGPPVLVFNLVFGKSISGRRDLTDREWRQFLDDTVTANLPNGYTVVDAQGAWMNPITHGTIGEGSKLLIVALPIGPESLAAVNRIRNEYQVRFRQQLVGMAVEQASGSF